MAPAGVLHAGPRGLVRRVRVRAAKRPIANRERIELVVAGGGIFGRTSAGAAGWVLRAHRAGAHHRYELEGNLLEEDKKNK